MSRKFALVGALVCASACTGGGSGRLDGPWDDGTDWTWEEPELADAVAEWEGYADDDGDVPASRCAKGVRPTEVVPVAAGSDPDAGELRARKGDQVVALPLAETSFDTIVLGTVADTEVRQVFENPFEEAIEAVYVFPLPHDAAVDDYAIEIGDRTIRGVMKRRGEARADYEAARKAGHSAGLLEQERPNIFTQSIANIPPGERITVVMHMVGPVTQDRGRFELALPTVVGPRYIPGHATGRSGGGFAPDTDQVADGSKVTPKVLPEGYVGCAALSVTVEIDAGAKIDVLASKAHEIVHRESGGRHFVELARDAEALNRDFVLGWSLATAQPTTSLALAPDGDGGYFQLAIMPPRLAHAAEPTPRELVLVLDTSGSMDGQPLAVAKGAMRGFLEHLGPHDAFQVIRFSSEASQLGPAPLPNTKGNVDHALRHIARLRGEGGTEMLEGIKAALDFPYTDGRTRYVLFLTDGFIGNDQEIFVEVARRLDKARVFSLGVGSSPNRYLLDGLARAGRGAVTYVETHEDPREAVKAFYRRLAHPVLTDLEIEWGDLDVVDVVPARIPDLFTGQPVVVYGRLRGTAEGEATLVGRAGKERIEIPVRIEVAKARRTDGLASMWARARIQELEDSLIGDPARAAAVERDVTDLALEHRVMSQYTAFVAVDKSRVAVPGGDATRFDVPVDLPQGMSTSGLGGEALYSFDDADAEPAPMASGGAPEDDAMERPHRLRSRRTRDAEAIAQRRLERAERSHRRALDKCFVAASKRGTATGPHTVEVTIDADGSIASVRLPDADDDVLARCLREEIQSWTIHRPGDHAILVVFSLPPP
jgi:Ca-activated chloride channel family protein